MIMSKRLRFSKYHGLGNDFVMVDNTKTKETLTPSERRLICDRKYGIGANGLVLLGESEHHAFLLDYYNADGHLGSLCGNASRCALAFARKSGLIGDKRASFEAYDGVHFGRYVPETGVYSVEMADKRLEEMEVIDDVNYFVDTGSPHHVRFVDDLDGCDVTEEGRQLRNDRYGAQNGANIDFVKEEGDMDISVRTYERGVEEETDACGTGAVAVAMVIALRHFRSEGGHEKQTKRSTTDIKMRGGKLSVKYQLTDDGFQRVELIGDAVHVFDGEYTLLGNIQSKAGD